MGCSRVALLTTLLLWQSLLAAAEFVGVIEAQRDLELSLGVGGLVVTSPHKVGDSVAAGDLLLQLDDELQRLEAERRKLLLDSRVELEVAEQRVRIQTTIVNDARLLFREGQGISRDDLLSLEMDLVAMQGEVDNLRLNKRREDLDYRTAVRERELRRLVAPVSGVITRIEPQIGEWVRGGDPVLQLVDDALCYLRVSVPERIARRLELEQQLPIRSEAGERIDARLTFISPIADRSSGLVELRLELENGDRRVRAGSKGRLVIEELRPE
jgi:RND family efflux transporter MFP subunit